MKNILKALAVTGAIVGMSGGVALADTVTCKGSLSNTGPGSTNTVSCVDDNNVKVSCDNNIVIKNTNDQTSETGLTETSDNTSGGSSTSGNSSNSNSTVVNVGASCSPVPGSEGGDFTVTPPTPTGGSGGQVLSESAQVKKAPVGGVGAGAGAGTASNNVAASAGILGSAGLVGLGLALRKHAFGRN